MISCHRERIGKHLVVPAELQRRIESRLQGNQPKLLEPLRLGAREAVVHHVGVGGAPPERQRASEVRAREGGVPLRQCLDGVVVKTLEPVGVEYPSSRWSTYPVGVVASASRLGNALRSWET